MTFVIIAQYLASGTPGFPKLNHVYLFIKRNFQTFVEHAFLHDPINCFFFPRTSLFPDIIVTSEVFPQFFSVTNKQTSSHDLQENKEHLVFPTAGLTDS